MLPRQAHATLQTLSRGFPVVAVTGPRQSGKTTLAQTVFADLAYLNLEDPDTRELARADPLRFLARHANGMILDEVQRVPELLSYLLGHADATQRMGRIVLTGSQQLGLMDGITQSLAGRVGLLTLLPLSHAELVHAQAAPASRDTVSLEQRLELLADGDGTEATRWRSWGWRVARGAH